MGKSLERKVLRLESSQKREKILKMTIITRALVFVALVCMISALPVENGQEQEAQVDLLSVDDVPQQDAESTDGQVRDKRHGFYGGFGVPVVSVGYGGKCAI